jgi:hypothetical protein
MQTDPIVPLTTLQKVERIKLLLTQRAEGGQPNGYEYSTLRSELVCLPELEGKLPEMVIMYRTINEFWTYIKPLYGSYHERREHIREQFHDLLTELETRKTNPTQKPTEETLKRLNSEEVQKLFTIAMNRTEKDANGAVTAAKSLLESTCKLLLDDMKEAYTATEDIPSLFKKISTKLNLHPTQHPNDSLKKILSGCASIVQGIAETRNKISDAHGQGRNPMNAAPRHAKLAVGMAGAMSAFLVETYKHMTDALG